MKLPDDARPLLTITKALLSAEINICYMYPLLIGVGPMGNTAIAVYVDDFESAAAALVTVEAVEGDGRVERVRLAGGDVVCRIKPKGTDITKGTN